MTQTQEVSELWSRRKNYNGKSQQEVIQIRHSGHREAGTDNVQLRRDRYGEDIIDKGRAEGKKGLRRAQYEKAVMDKDVRMLIFLGKNYLEQSDTPSETESNEPLPWPEDA